MNQTLPSEQEVDQLLDVFFKSEMPRAWPAFRAPWRRTLPFRGAAPRRRFVLGSKVALAASVALLTACGWLLSGDVDGPARPGASFQMPPDGKATKPQHQDQRPDDAEPDDLIGFPFGKEDAIRP